MALTKEVPEKVTGFLPLHDNQFTSFISLYHSVVLLETSEVTGQRKIDLCCTN